MNGFWEAIDAQVEEIRRATTVDELLAACPPVEDMSVGDGFFAGSGGDEQVLYNLGPTWTAMRVKADYYWVAQDAAGACVTYVEGDLYRGDKMTEWAC